MKYYGIKTTSDINKKSYIYWIGTTKFESWRLFFSEKSHRLPLEEAIRAYESIGYKCVEVELTEKIEEV